MGMPYSHPVSVDLVRKAGPVQAAWRSSEDGIVHPSSMWNGSIDLAHRLRSLPDVGSDRRAMDGPV